MIFAAVEGKYIGKILHMTAGHSLSLQYHLQKDETISVLDRRRGDRVRPGRR